MTQDMGLGAWLDDCWKGESGFTVAEQFAKALRLIANPTPELVEKVTQELLGMPPDNRVEQLINRYFVEDLFKALSAVLPGAVKERG